MHRYSRAVGYLDDVSLFLLAVIVIAVHGYFSKSRVPLIQYCLNPTWPASCFKFSSNVTGLPQISSPCVKVLNSAGIEAGTFRAAGHGHWAVSLGTLAKPQSLEAASAFHYRQTNSIRADLLQVIKVLLQDFERQCKDPDGDEDDDTTLEPNT